MKNDKKITKLLRQAAHLLRHEHNTVEICIPMYMSHSDKEYPMGIQPGYYTNKNTAAAIQFLADMIEE